MNKFRSLLTVALLSTSNIRARASVRSNPLPMVSHVALSSRNDAYEAMTVKALRKLLTSRNVKGRSKLVRKADITAKLRSL